VVVAQLQPLLQAVGETSVVDVAVGVVAGVPVSVVVVSHSLGLHRNHCILIVSVCLASF
jgi:hypothetical protein